MSEAKNRVCGFANDYARICADGVVDVGKAVLEMGRTFNIQAGDYSAEASSKVDTGLLFEAKRTNLSPGPALRPLF